MLQLRYPILALLLLLGAFIRAEVTCPVIFGDHMVLQRERPVTIWGNASAGEKITVLFAGQKKTTTATAEGTWRVDLDAMPASRDPRILTVRGENNLNFSDVLVGEVWFCSGQSNMEKQLGPSDGQKPTDNYEAAIREANQPLLRLYQVPRYGKPSDRIIGLQWVPCSPDTIAATEFSAASYYFGSEIQRDLDVPVGLIHSSHGGTRIDAWLPPQAFERPELRGLPGGPGDRSFNGVAATKLYETMVAPFVPYALRGFLWYQGESNLIVGDTSIYTTKLRILIESWRTAWSQPKAPFNYVLLAPLLYSKRANDPAKLTPQGLPLFWEAQLAALAVPQTGLVSTTDISPDVEDIHPTNKRDVGLRLARLALAETYGRTHLVARSPCYSSMKISSGKITLAFNHTGKGLHARDGKPLDGFLIAGDDQQFFPATAVINKNKVIVSCDSVKNPVAVRYAWAETANPKLVNSAGLPAIPFRTDKWPINYRRPTPPPAPAGNTESVTTPKQPAS